MIMFIFRRLKKNYEYYNLFQCQFTQIFWGRVLHAFLFL